MRLSEEVIKSDRKRMSGRTWQVARSSTGLGGIGGFLFGLVFFATGTGITLVGLKVIPVVDSSVNAPYWVLAVIGAVFAAAGVMVWGMTVKALMHGLRCRAAKAANPSEPAFGDYPWDHEGITKGVWGAVVKAFVMAFFMAAFLSPFNWWAWASPDDSIFVKVIVSIFDLLLVMVIYQAFHSLLCAIRYGPSKLQYKECPYRPGGEIWLQWLAPNGLNQSGSITFTLRCVEEWMETTGSGKNRQQHQVNEQLWASTRTTQGQLLCGPSHPIDISFTIPADAPGSAIGGEKKARFWELEVHADVPGVDFKQQYLVPIYKD